jgi:hypothetical protein
MSERTDRLDAMLREGRLIRRAWTKGHDRACLLAALSPEAGAAESASACPAEIMPPWLAHMTPWLDDAPSAEAWPSIVARYAALARRWGVLDDAAWERARVASLLTIVSEARSHVAPEYASVLAAIDGVLGWLRRGAPESEREAAAAADAAWEAASADAADAAAWEAARAAAWAAASADAAWEAARAAAWASADAADAAAWEAARAAAWAADAAAWEAARAAAWAAADAACEAARAARAARAAAWAAARAAAADRIAAGVLDAIEHEIERTEAAR